MNLQNEELKFLRSIYRHAGYFLEHAILYIYERHYPELCIFNLQGSKRDTLKGLILSDNSLCTLYLAVILHILFWLLYSRLILSSLVLAIFTCKHGRHILKKPDNPDTILRNVM